MGRVTVNPSRLKAPGPSLSLSGKSPIKVAVRVECAQPDGTLPPSLALGNRGSMFSRNATGVKKTSEALWSLLCRPDAVSGAIVAVAAPIRFRIHALIPRAWTVWWTEIPSSGAMKSARTA